jgi:hypothetical protein
MTAPPSRPQQDASAVFLSTPERKHFVSSRLCAPLQHTKVRATGCKTYFHDVKIDFHDVKINFQTMKIDFQALKITF